MSEFQRVAFRAIDGRVSAKNLEYMHEQSSRADITPLSFDNEYNYGDFRGKPKEMLSRGYDFHLHFANFGIRKLMFWFPNGLPNYPAAQEYECKDSSEFIADKKGPGIIFQVSPEADAGTWDYVSDLDDLIERLVPLRAEILAGDLRPLYITHLIAGFGNEEWVESAVPAGLNKLTDAQEALAEFYELDLHIIAAAAEGCPPLSSKADGTSNIRSWLAPQSEVTKTDWLAEIMTDAESDVRRRLLAEFQKANPLPSWPTVRLNRTGKQLESRANVLRVSAKQKATAKAKRDRASKLETMAADPAKTIQEAESRVRKQDRKSYAEAAKLLVDLREALTGTEHAHMAEEQAELLRKKYPTFRTMISELRKAGLLKK